LSLNLSINSASRSFLADISQLQANLNQATQEVSSGYKVSEASDAPDQISTLLQLEANLQSNNQISTNLSNVKAQVDTGESALNSAVQLTQQALSLGAEGANSIDTAAQTQTLATQVQGILSQLVGIANTNVAGTYIFSGDQGTSPSYQLDPTSPTGVDSLIAAPQATQQIQDTSGNTYAISETAQTIFDNRNPDGTVAANNLFSAVNSLQVALANNDTAGINTAVASLQTAYSYLNQQQAFYGGVQDQVAASITTAQSQNVSLTTQIGSIRDADLTQAAVELTAGQTAETAAFSAEAKLPTTSLFNYLG
jgi:flagellar hook-associated protein 3 FlgL